MGYTNNAELLQIQIHIFKGKHNSKLLSEIKLTMSLILIATAIYMNSTVRWRQVQTTKKKCIEA